MPAALMSQDEVLDRPQEVQPVSLFSRRAEDLEIRIEGALIVCAGTGDCGVFERTICSLKRSLLAEA